ncbi:MAG: hypothetical protein Q9159_000186 [Coniocarpon cinnabarinum]
MASVNENVIVQALLKDPHAKAPKEPSVETEWRNRAEKMTAPSLKDIEPAIAELDAHLTLRSYIADYRLTTADLVVWGTLRNNRVALGSIKQGIRINLSRWFNFIDQSNPWISEAVNDATGRSATSNPKKDASASKSAPLEPSKPRDPNVVHDDTNYDIGLQDTEAGVVTRFPPEPSGYLHIGHAKAALLNDYFAHVKYKGTLLCRFDDTNPLKEKQEFEDSIVRDLELMGIKPDRTTHTSDYFQELHDWCIQMIKSGHAYADDTDQTLMREQRLAKEPSARRNLSADESLARFEDMKSGSEEGQHWFIRAKIDHASRNGAMRDPVIYRCSPQPHHRTGATWKVYPTYDFACPLIDVHEGVTHALRTTEYKDRDAQYQWMLSALQLRKVHNWDFNRLNFVRTLLSKRKLTKFVDEGVVWGWDDPRMPTIRGIRRRGCTVAGLREFILKQGPSRNIVNLDWTSFWATNKKYIDPVAARYTAISQENAVSCTITGARANPYSEEKPLHAKYDLGTKKIWYSSSIFLEQSDAQEMSEGEEITLMNWGNAIIRSISHTMLGLSKTVSSIELDLNLQGDVKKTKKKVTWLSRDQDLVPCELVEFDFLITKEKLEEEDKVEDFMTPQTEFRTKCWGDCNVAGLPQDAVMQFDRRGYFRVDREMRLGEAVVLFQIPTGKKGERGA